MGCVMLGRSLICSRFRMCLFTASTKSTFTRSDWSGARSPQDAHDSWVDEVEEDDDEEEDEEEDEDEEEEAVGVCAPRTTAHNATTPHSAIVERRIVSCLKTRAIQNWPQSLPRVLKCPRSIVLLHNNTQ
uniref:Secreted protein n=1 Tax=Knipowitschia caucasica TaxID=637954 RepID=A0AAV2JYV3_KNICA